MSDFIQNYYETYWQHRIKTKKISTQAPLRVKTAADLIPANAQSVLDIGCGEGSLGRLLQNTNRAVDGIDISETTLKLAQPFYRKTKKFDITDTSNWSQFKEKYDTIVSLEIIEHLIDPGLLLEFVHQKLHDEGVYIVSFPNTGWWKYRWDLFFKGIFIEETPAYSYLDHLHFFTLSSLTRLLEDKGFIVQKVDGVFSLPWYLGRLPHSWQRAMGSMNPSLFGYQVVLQCKKKASKPLVVHFTKDFLNPSETWIESQVISQRHFDKVVLCRDLKHKKILQTSSVIEYPALYHHTTELPTWGRKVFGMLERLIGIFTERESRFYKTTLAKLKPALVHAHFGPNGYEIAKVCQQLDIPLVVSFYGSDVLWLPKTYPQWKARYRELFSIAETVVVKGPLMKQRIEKLGCDPKKIVVLDHGVAVENISFNQVAFSKEPKLCIAGRLEPIKGIDVAINALPQLQKKYPGITLTIIGSGSQESALRSLAKKRNVHVTFVPFLAHQQLVAAMQNFDIFLQLSREFNGAQEGIPTTLLEAMASGRVVVATKHSDIQNVVKDTQNGLLINENDVDGLIEAIDYLMMHPKSWKKLSQQARNTIETDFNEIVQTKKREELYQSLTKL